MGKLASFKDSENRLTVERLRCTCLLRFSPCYKSGGGWSGKCSETGEVTISLCGMKSSNHRHLLITQRLSLQSSDNRLLSEVAQQFRILIVKIMISVLCAIVGYNTKLQNTNKMNNNNDTSNENFNPASCETNVNGYFEEPPRSSSALKISYFSFSNFVSFFLLK